MQTVQQQLQHRVEKALDAVLPAQSSTHGNPAAADVSPEALQVVPCANPQFGDYQWNGALPLAKALGTNPRALAQSILQRLDVAAISEMPEIAGPGFINFRLKPDFVAATTAQLLDDTRVSVPQTDNKRTVVVDFSSPNVAKPMHVGHIRSTIIGDAIARLLRFAGHHVITDNHIGDWGTQFGKIIIGWKKYLDEENLARDPVGEMERLYKLVNAQTESDPEVAAEARRETANLQNGDEENLAIWQRLRDLSKAQFDEIYGLLDISFDQALGESFYNPRLGDVVRDLQERGIAIESQGAIVVPFDEPPQLADKPMLVQKSDGSALYGTTDLATIQYRVETWHPDEIVYVVGAPQALHFQQVFLTAQRWGFIDVKLRHVAFGTVLGEDKTPIKTRSGESVKLKALLEEAQTRALQIVREKNPDLNEEQQRNVARVVGVGAVKYADLSQNRTSDYVFSWDKMLAIQGNSAPYLQYAYVRIRSIFRRAEYEGIVANRVLDSLILEQPAELELAKFILRFPLAIDTALSDYRLNALSDYLFDLAQKLTAFYAVCPVLRADEPLRSSRMALCELTARVLKHGLNLLGIETIEQM